ncbi:MAG: YggS family pyridoxal phosphate-dependent enzyme [Candidatus Nanopelagicales bacterium]
MNRKDELASNLKVIQSEIMRACEQNDRDPNEITLIAITKNFPASDIRLLNELGVNDFGESRVQEFSKKYEEVSDLISTWHFIGQVQSNKIREITRLADVVHSLDSDEHIEKFNSQAQKVGKTIDLLIQINLDPDYPNSRAGVSAEEAENLATLIHRLGNVNLGGLMFIASPQVEARQAFKGFAEVLYEFRKRHPSAKVVSAGMSSDLQEAIQIGATHLRIGSKLLGNRPL